MSIAELKTHLHQLIDGTSDNSVLAKVFALLSKTSTNDDWWDELSEESKQKTLKSIDQSKNGEVISHELAMQQLAEKFPQLKF